MDLITVKMNQLYIKSLDKLVEMGMYPSRSEAIRVAIRDLLQKELWPEEGMPAKRKLRAEASE
ncbi:MAG: ribbon-helix-helix protein, CopG family [Candidatus Thorarchaeota archaeon]|jgi:antitoxin ParD1/3/4|nr:ribbon-helix-helix protein, CopG family [Candidatus Thorarchaeota archaeon]